MRSAKRTSRFRASSVALLALASLAGTGCTTIGRRIGAKIPVEQAELEEGVTRVRRIVETLGPPTLVSALPDGMVMVYEYVDARERQFGLGLDFIGLDWFKVAVGRAAARREYLLLLFDGEGVLRAKDFSRWTDDLGKGFGFQFIFVAAPTVDTSHLNAAPEQFRWGRSALAPLPVTLNEGQSLVSGSHGIEMRGTPVSVGQHTLEMHAKGRAKRDK